jgi:hypothetical protein
MILLSLRLAQKSLSFCHEQKCTHTHTHTHAHIHTHKMAWSMTTSHEYFVHSGQESTLGMTPTFAVLYPQTRLYWSSKAFRMLLCDFGQTIPDVSKGRSDFIRKVQQAASFRNTTVTTSNPAEVYIVPKYLISFILLARQPPVSQGLLIHKASRSHTTTHHSR